MRGPFHGGKYEGYIAASANARGGLKFTVMASDELKIEKGLPVSFDARTSSESVRRDATKLRVLTDEQRIVTVSNVRNIDGTPL